MAETVHLFLKVGGNDIKGESTQTSLGREGSIECISYEQEVKTAREKGTNVVTGRRQYEPLVITKRIDRASPLLVKALAENSRVTAVFKFFRPNPNGDGTTQQFYSVELKEANISEVKQEVKNTIDPASSGAPPMEKVSFVFNSIVWTFTDGGITHQDSWREGSGKA